MGSNFHFKGILRLGTLSRKQKQSHAIIMKKPVAKSLTYLVYLDLDEIVESLGMLLDQLKCTSTIVHPVFYLIFLFQVKFPIDTFFRVIIISTSEFVGKLTK